jgi:hypothetical protein
MVEPTPPIALRRAGPARAVAIVGGFGGGAGGGGGAGVLGDLNITLAPAWPRQLRPTDLAERRRFQAT